MDAVAERQRRARDLVPGGVDVDVPAPDEHALRMLLEERHPSREPLRLPEVVVVEDRDVLPVAISDQRGLVVRVAESLARAHVAEPPVTEERLDRGGDGLGPSAVLGHSQAPIRKCLGED